MGLLAQTEGEGKWIHFLMTESYCTALEELWGYCGKQQDAISTRAKEHQIGSFTYTTSFHLNHIMQKDVCKDKLKMYWVFLMRDNKKLALTHKL